MCGLTLESYLGTKMTLHAGQQWRLRQRTDVWKREGEDGEQYWNTDIAVWKERPVGGEHGSHTQDTQ